MSVPVSLLTCLALVIKMILSGEQVYIPTDECPSKSSDLFSPGNKDDLIQANRSISQQMSVPVSLLTWSIEFSPGNKDDPFL